MAESKVIVLGREMLVKNPTEMQIMTFGREAYVISSPDTENMRKFQGIHRIMSILEYMIIDDEDRKWFQEQQLNGTLEFEQVAALLSSFTPPSQVATVRRGRSTRK